MDPDVGSTFSLLNALPRFPNIADQKIDGVDCYHYEGNLIWSQNQITAVDILGPVKMIIYLEKRLWAATIPWCFPIFNQSIVIAAP